MKISRHKKQTCFGSILLLLLWLASCGGEVHKHPVIKPYTREQLMDANKADTRRESDDIDAYVRRHGWEMKASGTGLRYQFISQSAHGDTAKTGQWAKVSYKVFLLDGTLCYSSDKDGLKDFKIGEDHVESGIHEVILLMKTGDRMRFILPSARAHGLLGDGDKIPPRAPVMYEVQLISLR
jgi:FKBP-type peptidyl-prolyl cis-trans isomerase FkpA